MIKIKKWVDEVMSSTQRIAIPIMTHPGIELCGYKVIDAVKDGRVHFEAIKKLYDTYPAGACTVIMDLTVEAETFGATINFPENEVPTVTGRLVSDYDSVKNLEVPGLDKGRMKEYLKANRLTAENIKDKPVFAGCIGPFSLAGRLFDITELMMALYMEPETATLLLEKCTQLIHTYCKAIKETGVDGVIIAEPAAGLLSNDDCSLYSSTYIKQIVQDIQDDDFMIILHNCGNTGHCTQAMLETKAAGYHFGNKADMVEILKECPSDVLVLGNLDPVGIFKMSTPETVRAETMNLLQKTAPWKNYILSSGCDTPPGVPFENIEVFYQTLSDYNTK